MSNSASEPSRWQKLGQAVQARTRIFDLLGVRYRHPLRNLERDYVVLQAPDWVNVIALTSAGHVVLVRQFRYGIGELGWEVPGGVMDPGEDPVAAGQRELREETGYGGSSARLLGSVHPNPAIQSNRCHIVLVEGAVLAHPISWDADEEIQVATLPVDAVLAKARAGGITHALVLNALWMLEGHLRSKD